MSLEQWYMKTIVGANTKAEDLELDNKFVVRAQNCRFEDEPGAVSKRPVTRYYNSTSLGSGATLGATRFYTSGGTIQTIAVHNQTVYLGDDSQGTFSSIRALSNANRRMNFVTYRDILIGSNGYDNPFCYDGSDSVTWELGSCKATTGAGTGVTASSISYQVVISTSSTNYICGAISNTIANTTAASIRIDLEHIPLGPASAVARVLYRKSSETNNEYHFLDTIANNSAETYTDTKASCAATAAIGSVTDDMPVGNILQIHRERLFVSGDPNNPNRIYYSNPYLPHYIQKTTNLDYLDITKDDGDTIMGIPIQQGRMFVIKRNTIRPVYIASPTSGADPAVNWYADDPVVFTGSPAQWSILQTPAGIIFLGWDHWYRFDGSGLTHFIPQFDVLDINPSLYYDVVAHWNKGILYAAYSDHSVSANNHDRLMVYNLKRDALSVDLLNINCFTSYSGDSESGEMLYGDSVNGYFYRAEETTVTYRLSSKTQAVLGSEATVFVGGTETEPYIEIGETQTASAIPQYLCIFWDSEDTNPGGGWTEITGMTNRFIKINATTGTTASAVSHTHNKTFETNAANAGEESSTVDQAASKVAHTHSVTVSSTAVTCEPKSVAYRVFYKNTSTTEYEFPVGAIIGYDQETVPEGWYGVGHAGYYIKLGTTSLGTEASSTHSHTVSGISGQDSRTFSYSIIDGTPSSRGARIEHTHGVTASTYSTSLDTWDLDYVAFSAIKRIGETTTWDGTDKYAYCLFYNTTAASGGWEDMTSTYNNRYFKIGTAGTGSSTNAAHTHVVPAGDTEYATMAGIGNASGETVSRSSHYHTYDTFTTDSGTAGAPASLTFKLFRKVLGKMKDYNKAIETQYTAGTYYSPSLQINAETLSEIFWNATIAGASDTITVSTRTAATSGALTTASWSSIAASGDTIGSSANVWIQYKVAFTAVDTRVANPRIYMATGNVLRFTYYPASTVAETSVEFIYQLGYRHFDKPMQDKIYKKIATMHSGTTGYFKVQWETENASDEFTIDLGTNPKQWDSYFQDDAYGKKIDITVYKNDLYDFTLKEIAGIYDAHPIIL